MCLALLSCLVWSINFWIFDNLKKLECSAKWKTKSKTLVKETSAKMWSMMKKNSIYKLIWMLNVLFLFCPKYICPILFKKIVCLFLRSQLKNLVVPAAKSLLPFRSLFQNPFGQNFNICLKKVRVSRISTLIFGQILAKSRKKNWKIKMF